MRWHNEPASWQQPDGQLQVRVAPGTDFWRVTRYGYSRDNGHLYGQMIRGDLDLAVRVGCGFRGQYDQAGLMLRADERVWLKAGVEFFNGRARLSTVLTVGYSSWMMGDLPDGAAEVSLSLTRREEAVEVTFATAGRQPELAAIVYLPPDREVLAGVMCAAPESDGFTATFADLRIAALGPRELVAEP